MDTAAIFYARDGFDTSGPRLLGRQAAGESFLKSLVEHGRADALYCLTGRRKSFDDFVQRVRPWSKRERRVTWVKLDDYRGLSAAGTLYRPDILIEPFAWQRRFVSPRAYSVCGVTHTIATHAACDALGRLLTAPLERWDALVCTSEAVRSAVTRIHESYAQYLLQRLNVPAVPKPVLRLPVIPLGIDCDAFAPSAEKRAAVRNELAIFPNDIAALFVGRLIAGAKAHPAAMYLALERVARETGRKIHLIQAGWFEDPAEEAKFKEGAAALCPSVRCLFLDGRKPHLRSTIWSGADLFMSLSDNVQETFGITPIEAMAAGLPVVVSDWDGYKETVRDGVDGFRIATRTPPPGAGLDWAAAFSSDAMTYTSFVNAAAMCTAVDVKAAASAVKRLVEEPELRAKLGENGRQRAREVYDWRVVIRAYEELWLELGQARKEAPELCPVKPGAVPNPLCDDPFRLFGHYPSERLGPETVFAAEVGREASVQSFLRSHALATSASSTRAKDEDVEQLLALLAEGPRSAAQLAERFADIPAHVLYRTLGHLLKLDLLRIAPPQTG